MDDITGEVDYLKEVMHIALDTSDMMLYENYNENHQYHQKGERDFALDVDIDVEQGIRTILEEADENIPVLGEESAWGERKESSKFWVVDPIDGTVNYSRQVPLFGTCIALIEDGQPVLAGLSFPALNERYIAGKGEGAFLNDERVYVSQVNALSEAIVGFGDFAVGEGAAEKNRLRFRFVESLAEDVLRIRMLGSAALQLAWLAAGKADASVVLSNKSWDVQAGVLVAREAGALVYDGDGSEHNMDSKFTLASVSNIKAQLLEKML